MPTIVDEVPAAHRAGREKKYDFSDLYKALLKSGKAVEMVQGEDFKCSAASMKQTIYKDAKENDLKAKVWGEANEDKPDRVIFSVRKVTAEDRKADDERQAKRAAREANKEADQAAA